MYDKIVEELHKQEKRLSEEQKNFNYLDLSQLDEYYNCWNILEEIDNLHKFDNEYVNSQIEPTFIYEIAELLEVTEYLEMLQDGNIQNLGLTYEDIGWDEWENLKDNGYVADFLEPFIEVDYYALGQDVGYSHEYCFETDKGIIVMDT